MNSHIQNEEGAKYLAKDNNSSENSIIYVPVSALGEPLEKNLVTRQGAEYSKGKGYYLLYRQH